MKRKIGVVTGSRAEYGLLYWLLKELEQHADVELQLYVTGAHLSELHGSTYQTIEADGFTIDCKIDLQINSDSQVVISNSIGIGTSQFGQVFAKLRPDIIVVLGDRYEMLAVATAALIARIPIAHIHGGEVTEGAFDDSIRHAITKLSHLHFTAAEPYRQRVIQLGEQPDRVFCVGPMAAANFRRLKLLSKSEFEVQYKFRLGTRNLLISFHPATLDPQSSETQTRDLLKALDELPETKLIFTLPNADPGNMAIRSLMKEFAKNRPEKAVVFASMGQTGYLSALKWVNGIVGNSSSGLLEAPFLGVGTINIGDRQKGRLRASSVIDCAANYESIQKALQQLFSSQFSARLNPVQLPYPEIDPVERIVQILTTADLSRIVQKSFYDLPSR